MRFLPHESFLSRVYRDVGRTHPSKAKSGWSLRLFAFAFSFASVGLGAELASAQPIRSASPYERLPVELLSPTLDLTAVPAELDLSEDQLNQLADIPVTIEEELETLKSRFAEDATEVLAAEAESAPRPQQARLLMELQLAVKALAKSEEEQLAEVLLPHQLERLKELNVQRLGAKAFLESRIAEELELTEAQLRELPRIIAQEQAGAMSQVRSLNRSDPDYRQELIRAVEEANRAVIEKVVQSLDESQQRKYRALRGEWFDFTKEPEPESDSEQEDDGDD